MAKAYVKHDYAVTGRDYVETDGGDTPGGGASYSTEEREIGTGVDGNPLYEKTLTTPDSTAGNQYIFNIPEDAINVEIFSGYIDIGGSYMPFNLWFDAATNTYAFVESSSSRVIVGVIGWTPQTFKITIRYQKTE